MKISLLRYCFLSLMIFSVAMFVRCHWRSKNSDNTYTVIYNPNGATEGSVPNDSTVYYMNDTVTILGLSGTGINKGGSPFIYWSVNSDGSGTRYTMNQTLTIGSSDIVLYAQYDTSRTTPYVAGDTA